MTQIGRKTPSQTVAERLRTLRKRRGWAADRLAEACAEAGMPALNRSVIANIESKRRRYVTVEELLTLAYVLDVAPVHLLVPIESDEDRYEITPSGTTLSVRRARDWIRGYAHAPESDPRTYYSEVPADEFQQIPSEWADWGRRLRNAQDTDEAVRQAQARWREQQERGE